MAAWAGRSLAALISNPPLSVAAIGGGQARAGTLGDQLALELSEGREDAEHQAPVRGGGVEVGTLAGQHPQGWRHPTGLISSPPRRKPTGSQVDGAAECPGWACARRPRRRPVRNTRPCGLLGQCHRNTQCPRNTRSNTEPTAPFSFSFGVRRLRVRFSCAVFCARFQGCSRHCTLRQDLTPKPTA